ncbi:MAG: hypothetical protein H6R14_850 [Proteobacteria bacterium]|nr:hypothetical protein [Pseudomonadota bacterium]
MRILPVVWLAIALPSHADNSLSFSTGLDFSTGKYGATESTDTLYMPFGIKYETDDWTFRATIPYVESTGPSTVSGSGADRITLNNGQSTRRKEAGLGDIVLSGSWSALQQGPWLVELAAKVKLATADKNKGLSTGENDFSVQTEVYRTLASHTLFGTLGYKKMGDPDGTDLKDPFYASLGWSFRATPSSALGLSYDYRQKVQESGSPIRELTGFVTHKLDPHWKLQGYLVSGYSNASPDVGGGVFVFYTY